MISHAVVSLVALLGGPQLVQRTGLVREVHPAPAASFAIVNTGLGVSIVPEHMQVSRHHVSCLVGEGQQRMDLNGDGDFSDFILHLYDHRDGSALNFAVETDGQVLLDGRTLAFSIPEDSGPAPGIDLNGDGDLDDSVLFVHDVAAGTTVSTRLAGEAQLFGPDGLFAYIDEWSSGGTNLNGDGDAQDFVLMPFGSMPRALVPGQLGRPLRPRGPLLAASGLSVIRANSLQETSLGPMLFVGEPSQGGLDRNGDGDGFDQVVLARIRPGGVKVSNLGLVAATDLKSADDLLLLRVLEVDQGGADLNGDGDAVDDVAHVLEDDGTVSNLGLATLFGDVAGGTVALGVFEASQGNTDLTGDGDLGDRALFIRRPDGSLDNLSLAVTAITGCGERFLLVVSEFDQAETDLNGDGDLGDLVLFSYDTRNGLVQNLSSALGAVPKAGERLCTLVVSEVDAGADFNNDGDLGDLVLGFYDAELDTFWNTQLVVGRDRSPQNFFWFKNDILLLSGRFAAFRVWESLQGPGTDYNGDGDTDDLVAFVFDAATGTVSNTGLEGEPRLGDGLLGVTVTEWKQGGEDLNGDGDTSDIVLHVLRVD